ncbi:class I tRNA ligase family protein, partial [Candidatus Bathyarchaeota archaeon]|nr:class I tRNA ligase family protein [Candidatus Bathyarchaeota archaeon]
TKHRVDPDPTKKNVQDFALWKKRGPKKVGWDSPWGRGRPGWHIEDTAITTHYLGPQYDIHGGAIELMFPHHEAEIAQAEAATGKKPLVKYWVHTGVLKINGKKMSKSLGNFITIKDALKTYDSEILRFFFASTHYRSTKDFREKSLEQAKKNLQTLYTALDKIRMLTHKEGDEADEFEMENVLIETRARFIEAMDNDFNSPSAIKILFDLAKEVNKFADTHKSISNKLLETILKTFKELGEIFNILQKEEQAIDTGTLENIVNLIIELRDKFRESKNWETSDMLRSKLKEAGITIEDSEKGTIWKRTE